MPPTSNALGLKIIRAARVMIIEVIGIIRVIKIFRVIKNSGVMMAIRVTRVFAVIICY